MEHIPGQDLNLMFNPDIKSIPSFRVVPIPQPPGTPFRRSKLCDFIVALYNYLVSWGGASDQTNEDKPDIGLTLVDCANCSNFNRLTNNQESPTELYITFYLTIKI